MIKACLFDLDGVIVDTAKYHYIAWKELAAELGFEFTEKDNERLKGVSRMASLDILLSIGGITKTEKEKDLLAQRKNERYVSLISQMEADEILPGAKEFLTACRKTGIATALGSASKNAMIILERLKLNDLFDVIIDGTHTTKAKPDPEVFLLGAAALRVEPEHCVVFEDAEAGIEAALAAGMKCVGIGSSEVLGKANLVIAGLHQMSLEKLKDLQ
ncbi:beta-phosphoglucomutase [Xiashengella succiniciproducens]|jgi:beta-phosphoglucomutase|uniref:Beta-phosphoglucomutase n=1 Tax=Xiashengella succiniciproducens TaxID=2949635 RepID=A0A9J6ZNI4_9BACT|nr:beta-phosphoglucomutase [Alkaliflexus sp. Ai-910]URW79269.1 beta-phosphoglucomutase [Alkaliflexus sp. Ai-910]HHU01173.1 beta-phosphoglucomutase [Bacteroidales bacterium]